MRRIEKELRVTFLKFMHNKRKVNLDLGILDVPSGISFSKFIHVQQTKRLVNEMPSNILDVPGGISFSKFIHVSKESLKDSHTLPKPNTRIIVFTNQAPTKTHIYCLAWSSPFVLFLLACVWYYPVNLVREQDSKYQLSINKLLHKSPLVFISFSIVELYTTC
jgi:hypothetical protein